ncbi:MAG TPA: hypothetical protein VJS66_05180 [Burkholderiales bacterium]|nr:hypothetical protein [Burkholderiales bacterium]
MLDARLRNLIVMATVFGVGHHLDHVLRGNHVGWPITAQTTPFTYSLGFYPFVLLGWYLTRQGIVGAGFWSILTTLGAIFVGVLHFGPFAVEPPSHILNFYQSHIAGWFAFAWLITFLILLITTAAYGIVLWFKSRNKIAD